MALSHMRSLILSLLTIVFGWSIAPSALAMDVVKVVQAVNRDDHRPDYLREVVRLALEATKATFGPYDFKMEAPFMARDRALLELLRGEEINVHVVATRQEWEDKAIAIRIPILRGLLGYRLLITDKDHQKRFAKVRTQDELRLLRAGFRSQWTIAKAFNQLNLNTVLVDDYEELFGLLGTDRADYLPRGVNEIYAELNNQIKKIPNLIIEPNLALYIPLPVYIFVSPEHPEIAYRLSEGMEIMIENGTLDRLFHQYFDDDIKRAELSRRQIIELENPTLSKMTPLNRSDFWYRLPQMK